MNNKNTNQPQSKKIVIAERDNIAAVLEGKKVTDFFIHRGEVLLGDVYLATVDNILQVLTQLLLTLEPIRWVFFMRKMLWAKAV